MPGRKDLFKEIRVVLLAVISWFALSTAGELIGNQANDTVFGQLVGHWVLLAAVVVVPTFGIAWVVLAMRERRRELTKPAVEEDEPWSRPAVPDPWFRPEPLCARENEVGQALRRVLDTGVVALVGPRDVGTSAVAAAVAQRLIDEHGGDPEHTFRFDVRSRSTRGPDGAAATAGRVVAAFGIDEPSDDTEEVLARVAGQLVGVLTARGGILLLDNVSMPEQVWWLVRDWPAGGRVRLVVAGEPAVGDAVEHRVVAVGELDLAGLRQIWDAEMGAPGLLERVGEWVRQWRGTPNAEDAISEVLRACFGRPRAVKAIVEEIKRSSDTVTAQSLRDAMHAGGELDGPLERVWTAMLDNIREGLSDEAVWLLCALAELPVTGLTRGAVAAMLGSDDLGPLEELRVSNLVVEQGGRYRLPQEIRRAIARTGREDERRKVALGALPALVRYVAGHAERWSLRLDTQDARAWFRDSEPTLRPLFSEEHYADEELLELVLPDLGAIADALEVWYVREHRSRGLLEVNAGLYALVCRARREDLAALAAIRQATAHRLARRPGEAAGALDLARAHVAAVPDDRPRAELDGRAQVESALLAMTTADADALHEAVDELGRLRGAGRLAGHPELLVNLGALCLGRGRVAEALAHLYEAEELAVDARDAGCEAHAVELQGVALSQQDGQLVEAARRWLRARATFTRIGEDRGVARCLQHLGSAALVDPRVAGRLRDGRMVPLPRHEAAAVAVELLERAKSLRTGQPDTGLVDHYLARAREQLG
ncbi:hypothetical protein [Actinophytocola sp.]|uniref:hypothetical protein n=1 Tax=Actinophytocola sp. TaxID=1872138 RepID=UPI003D6C52C0